MLTIRDRLPIIRTVLGPSSREGVKLDTMADEAERCGGDFDPTRPSPGRRLGQTPIRSAWHPPHLIASGVRGRLHLARAGACCRHTRIPRPGPRPTNVRDRRDDRPTRFANTLPSRIRLPGAYSGTPTAERGHPGRPAEGRGGSRSGNGMGGPFSSRPSAALFARCK